MTYNRILKTNTSLSARWQSLHIQNPHKSTREIAIELAVSEEQLIATRCGHDEENNTRLISQPIQIFSELAHLGEMEFVTDNTAIKHAVTAVFTNLYSNDCNDSNVETATNHIPLFSPKNVNAQFDLNTIHSIYALNEKGQLSLQFFDQQGRAVYKAYVSKKTSLKDYKALVILYKDSNQSPCKEHTFSQPYRGHDEQDTINKAQLLKTWNSTLSAKECEDIIEYYDDDERIAVYLSLGRLLATHLGSNTIKDLLEHLLKHEFSIKITSHNAAVQQAWTGVLTHKEMQNSILQLTGEHFKISIDTTAIGDLWLVRKPSSKDHKTVLEVYDKQQNHLLTLEEDGSVNATKDSNKWGKLMSMLVRIEQYSPSTYSTSVYST